MNADSESVEEIIRRAMHDLRECNDHIDCINKYQRAYWESKAGVELTKTMVERRDAAEHRLDDPDLRIRRVALISL